uniref:Cadherin domain-containing protein n=1 Tax=Parascaris equorum TaxID=6256 RepID=A0A914R810_PAREQ
MTISEDTPVGTSFMQITATDLDAGGNAFVDYYIDVNDKRALSVDAFKLDRSSGTLRIQKKLDREENDM